MSFWRSPTHVYRTHLYLQGGGYESIDLPRKINAHNCNGGQELQFACSFRWISVASKDEGPWAFFYSLLYTFRPLDLSQASTLEHFPLLVKGQDRAVDCLVRGHHHRNAIYGRDRKYASGIKLII